MEQKRTPSRGQHIQRQEMHATENDILDNVQNIYEPLKQALTQHNKRRLQVHHIGFYSSRGHRCPFINPPSLQGISIFPCLSTCAHNTNCYR
jgi:hypothetical protein